MDFAYIVLTMFGSRLSSSCLLAGLLVACGSGSANVVANASVGADATAESEQGRAGASGVVPGDAERGGAKGVAPAASAAEEPPPPPAHDPALVKEALDRTSATPDDRERLGLRLAVVEQGPNAPWVVAVVNRGSEPLQVHFDLRTLSLEITPPAPPEPAAGTKAKRPQKPPKPFVCALPKDVAPAKKDESFELALEPGEALIDVFDPRLYCPPEDVSRFVPGATVVPRLGFAEKTKTVWKNGKREQKVVEQTPPFVAELAERKEPEPVAESAKKPPPRGGDEPPAFEKWAVKLVVGHELVLGEQYAVEARPDESPPPLELVLARGSDAPTEREATITVSLLNRSSRAQTVYFRRELVSFEVSGPTGLVECDAGPDLRAPDRSSFSTLAPGKRISATSRLIELCPMGAMRAPGLYLVHGRFDSREGGEEFGLSGFRGRVVSGKPALVRVRKGWGALPAQRQPLRVRISEGGAPAQGASAP